MHQARFVLFPFAEADQMSVHLFCYLMLGRRLRASAPKSQSSPEVASRCLVFYVFETSTVGLSPGFMRRDVW